MPTAHTMARNAYLRHKKNAKSSRACLSRRDLRTKSRRTMQTLLFLNWWLLRNACVQSLSLIVQMEERKKRWTTAKTGEARAYSALTLGQRYSRTTTLWKNRFRRV